MTATVATEAGIPSSELDAVVGGAKPSADIVRKLAPAMGIHTADLFVIAGLQVPVDEASAWPTETWNVGPILGLAARMTPQQRGRLEDLIRSLPVESATGPAAGDDYPDGPGALMLRLMRNRNIRPFNPKILAILGGPHASGSTIEMLGPGRVVMTPQYVTALAYLLGYTPQDTVAIIGVGPVAEDVRVHPASADLARLAWNARRLTTEQLSQVMHESTRLLQDPD
jgi:hypothetical protein